MLLLLAITYILSWLNLWYSLEHFSKPSWCPHYHQSSRNQKTYFRLYPDNVLSLAHRLAPWDWINPYQMPRVFIYSLTVSLSLAFTTTTSWPVWKWAPLKDRISNIFECRLLSIKTWSIWCVISHQGNRSVFMNAEMWEHFARNNLLFSCGKIYYSNSIIITNFIQDLIPYRGYDCIFSAYICAEIS